MRLTKRQAEVLEMIREKRSAEGVCVNLEWRFTCNGQDVTRQVNALKRKAAVEVMYFTGGKASATARI